MKTVYRRTPQSDLELEDQAQTYMQGSKQIYCFVFILHNNIAKTVNLLSVFGAVGSLACLFFGHFGAGGVFFLGAVVLQVYNWYQAGRLRRFEKWTEDDFKFDLEIAKFYRLQSEVRRKREKEKKVA